MAIAGGFDGSTADLSDPGAGKHPPRITEAEDSFEAQQRARIRKYTIMMAFRVPALVIAVIVYMTWNLTWVAMIIVAISIPLPWMAVLIANDAPPRRKDRLRRYERPEHDLDAIARQLEGHRPPTIEG